MAQNEPSLIEILNDLCQNLYPYNLVTNHEGKILAVGSNYPEQFIHQPIFNLFSNEHKSQKFASFVVFNNLSVQLNDESIDLTGQVKYFQNEKLYYFNLSKVTDEDIQQLKFELKKEKAIRKEVEFQKDFFTSILENIPSDLAVFDTEHRYLFVNKHGIKNAEIRNFMFGKTDYDYCKLKQIDTRIADERRAIFNEIVQSKRSLEWEDNYILPNEDNQTIFRKMSPIFDENDELKYVIGYGIDISPVKKAELKAKKSEEHVQEANRKLRLLESFLNHSTDGMQVSNEKGQLIYINESASHRLGIEQNEIEKYTVFDFESVFKTEEDWLNHLTEIKEKGVLILEGKNINQLTKQLIPVEVSVRYQTINGEGYVIASSRDISERKEAERKLEDKNRYLQQITNAINASSLVSFTDSHGIITMVNDQFCKISQFSEEELIGKTHKIVASDYHPKEFWQEAWDTMLDKKIWSADVKNKAKDGSFYWVKTIIYPILNADGDIESFLSIRQNISLAKNNEIQLENQVKLQNLIMNIATKFINAPIEDIEDAINQSLKDIGQFVNADRSYIFDYARIKQTSSNLYEWTREGITPQIDNLQNVPFSDMPLWIEKHFKGEPMDIPEVADLPVGQLRELLEVQDIKSLLAIPLMKEGICIGFIGFDSVINNYTYSEQDKRILTIFAEMLVNVYIRRDHIHEIESSKEQIRQINLNLEKEVIEKTQKNTELSRLLTDQEKLAMIGEISAGIAHDLNTPLGSIKVGAESIRYTLENLFKSIIEKSTIEQLHFACNRAVENNIELFIGGIQSRKEAAVIEEYIRLNYPDTTFDVQTLASNLVKARISINETEVINKILQSPNPFDFLNLIYHIQTTRTFIDTILIASDKASQVVKNLRTFVRFDQHSTKGPVNLKDNIATVLNVFNYEINSKVELQFNVDSTITIEGYEIKLYQLWSNLIKNAIEAISGYGKLIIESKETEKSYEISIENDGDVIPDDVLQNMFTKFYTTKSKSNGTGLGLSIVQNVIEDHHAKIHVTSIPNSTRFTITFYK
jgi:PAS domain S-box-containing protein